LNLKKRKTPKTKHQQPKTKIKLMGGLSSMKSRPKTKHQQPKTKIKHQKQKPKTKNEKEKTKKTLLGLGGGSGEAFVPCVA
jgi:thiol:disulfide interchange protein